MLTPERIRSAILKASCHYANAARSIGITPDQMRAQMAKFRRKGSTFPPPTGEAKQNEQFYEPTPEVIRAECDRIQETWTPTTRRLRSVYVTDQVTVLRASVEDDSRNAEW
jgi:hypothetical protein